MISGSAPLLPEVQHFLKVVMCAPLVEGYGQTEATGAVLFSDSRDQTTRQVGGPTANFEIKLVDIPEMNYRSTDKDENGQLAPRGEIWARGPGVFLGYYHDKAKTEEAVTADGWLKSGDVGVMSSTTKAISIIDRKKNIFKLQQG
jgi:long-chain acyl-CoA synthetase